MTDTFADNVGAFVVANVGTASVILYFAAYLRARAVVRLSAFSGLVF